MLTRAMKVISIGSLVLAALFWNRGGIDLPVRFATSLGAFMVAVQAGRGRKLLWAAAFYAVVFVFNPFFAVIRFAGNPALVVVLAALVLFAASLRSLKTQQVLSIPSITGRTPGGMSL